MSRSRVILALLVGTFSIVVAPAAAESGWPSRPDPSVPGLSQRQSPILINVGDVVAGPLPKLRFEYETSTTVRLRYFRQDVTVPDCQQRGNEDTVRADVQPGAGVLWVGDDRYTLEQFHWHTPSEHIMNGRRYPAEQHLVHQGDNGRTLVVAVMTGDGQPHRGLRRLLAAAPAECRPDVTVRGVDLVGLLPPSRGSYRYEGSLTTAPYTEGISWVVLAQPLHATSADLAPLHWLFPDGNSRPMQPLGNRKVRTDLWGG